MIISSTRVEKAVATGTVAQRFREEAEKCRQQAARAVSELEREEWLRLAADWIKLAEQAEARRSLF